ncbi:hypothetical protein [Brucella anthropi]|uniref:hypothetical protein n=1 Tax=Brucella anthropi TaxID=529 RepID=UPI000F677515|nr:hypothetical protein [Brucella anthropi]RRY01483.1 hypothetical protein EGJ58_24835 [Brucella anthropi]
MRRNGFLEEELLEILGKEGLLTLTENYGGIRLYIPTLERDVPLELLNVFDKETLRKLTDYWGGDYLKVPLCREFRAIYYRQVEGLPNTKIALRLGITEAGVERIFRDLRKNGKWIVRALPEKAKTRADFEFPHRRWRT